MANEFGIGLPSDINVVDPGNSSTALLTSGATFTGQFVEVVGFTSVSVMLFADQIIDSAVLQWSSDKVNIDDEQEFFSDSWPGSFGQGIVVHSTIRSRYVRVKVINGGTGLAAFRLQTLLRKGAPTGYVSPLSLFPDDADDAQTVKAVLYGRRPSGSGSPAYTQVAVDGNGKLQMVRPPNPTANTRTETVAVTSPAQRLDSGFWGSQLKQLTVFNDTVRGNLFIRFGGDPTTTDFDVKVPPQGFLPLGDDSYLWGGSVMGIWDVADGKAHCSEIV